ncbi:hypothetical protein FACS189431_8110 [Alphaproteobacteria bacterium]|nr:hypothetical protein FACS189431_8110 [Alphaproteobacteria bacterium]
MSGEQVTNTEPNGPEYLTFAKMEARDRASLKQIKAENPEGYANDPEYIRLLTAIDLWHRSQQ